MQGLTLSTASLVLLSLSQVYAQWTVQCELKDDWEIVFAGGRKETDYRLDYGLRLELGYHIPKNSGVKFMAK